jgi:hypothetical protein
MSIRPLPIAGKLIKINESSCVVDIQGQASHLFVISASPVTQDSNIIAGYIDSLYNLIPQVCHPLIC